MAIENAQLFSIFKLPYLIQKHKENIRKVVTKKKDSFSKIIDYFFLGKENVNTYT